MSIFKKLKLKLSRDRPKDEYINSAMFFFGRTTTGKVVNENSAMQLTSIYACVRILSESVVSLPLHPYKVNDNGNKKKARDNKLYYILHDEQNVEMISFIFCETLMRHLLLWGNAYAQIIRNGKCEVIVIYPLMPNKIRVKRDYDTGEIYYEYQTDKGQAILKSSDLLHIPGLDFDWLIGYSPIAMAKNSIGMAIACEEYGAKFFSNGARPGEILEHPGTIKDPEKIRESWNSTFGGSENSNKIAVL